MVTITINGQAVEAPEGTSVLGRGHGGWCDHPHAVLPEGLELHRLVPRVFGGRGRRGACGLLQHRRARGHAGAHRHPAGSGGPTANLQAIMDDHRALCATCVRQDTCALRDLASTFNLTDAPGPLPEPAPWDADFPLQRDSSKCIKCMRCVAICEKVQHCAVWDFTGVGPSTKIIVRDNLPIAEAGCALCGQCITHCPTGALTAVTT